MTKAERKGPSRRRSRLAGAVWLVVAGVVASGCGGSGGTRTVASLPGHAASSASEPTRMTQAQSDQDMVSFTRCMRAHGVAVSDPVHRPGHAGLSIDLPTRDAATRPAYAACNHFIQAIVQAKERATAPVSSATLAALTRYARCMRAHDVGMLDPSPQGQLSLGNVAGITTDFGRYTPQFRDADTACRHLLPASVHDDGTGP
jgi:hypothetical protein